MISETAIFRGKAGKASKKATIKTKNKYYKYQRKLSQPDTAKKDSIIANACEHFGVSAESLLTEKKKGCRTTMIVMYAVYTEALHRHLLTSEAFGYGHAQKSFRALLHVEDMVRRNRKGAAIALHFYQKYGYCKKLWQGRRTLA